MVIYILTSGRRNEGSNDEINIGEEEEDGDRQSSFERRCPLLRVAMEGEGVEVEVDESASYENVDYG
jgi:hypothetical protein